MMKWNDVLFHRLLMPKDHVQIWKVYNLWWSMVFFFFFKKQKLVKRKVNFSYYIYIYIETYLPVNSLCVRILRSDSSIFYFYIYFLFACLFVLLQYGTFSFLNLTQHINLFFFFILYLCFFFFFFLKLPANVSSIFVRFVILKDFLLLF